MSLDNVSKTTGGSHVHGINIGFAEEGSRNGNDRGDADFHDLMKLALVAHVDIPFDVVVKSWPPEMVEEGALSGINALNLCPRSSWMAQTIESCSGSGMYSWSWPFKLCYQVYCPK
jgi:hypothetical protein